MCWSRSFLPQAIAEFQHNIAPSVRSYAGLRGSSATFHFKPLVRPGAQEHEHVHEDLPTPKRRLAPAVGVTVVLIVLAALFFARVL
jgi:hypothetical protein